MHMNEDLGKMILYIVHGPVLSALVQGVLSFPQECEDIFVAGSQVVVC